jgi:tRNA threonylcarbamoyladenosine biosynthesis protein TsaE
MGLDAIALTLKDEAATAALGATLADILRAMAIDVRDQGFTVGLMGDLGAGKTSLVRALLRRCGVTGAVKSPTFALLEPYEVSRLHFYHFDFYRFKIPEEFEDRGFGEYFAPGGVCLVEWPERAAGYLPRMDLQITLRLEAGSALGRDDEDLGSASEPGRTATIEAQTERGKRCLQKLESLWPSASAGA